MARKTTGAMTQGLWVCRGALECATRLLPQPSPIVVPLSGRTLQVAAEFFRKRFSG